ncbi:GatB/YqeY domain-containing protein [Heliocybe sulcata]|uniref:Altered inheritance of mitochondria protein 41 n=1 Tax=Heliocybe sulcata TaxID=5364 RepID=A0A5C3NC74_9AGAM|nr:GatB/YqeY domain-containing protein [Heliocybe sulcata]
MYNLSLASRRRLQSFITSDCLARCRRYSDTAVAPEDIRARLTAELKDAMKTKDSFKSTTLRSVLADIQAADKTSPSQKASPSSIVSIIRKATQKRSEAAAQFTSSSRPDLAQKEHSEIALLSSFLPPLLPESEIDRILKDVMATSVDVGENPRSATGKIYKAFYQRVDKSMVDPGIVKARAEALLIGHK